VFPCRRGSFEALGQPAVHGGLVVTDMGPNEKKPTIMRCILAETAHQVWRALNGLGRPISAYVKDA